jgi:hypothetical protein
MFGFKTEEQIAKIGQANIIASKLLSRENVQSNVGLVELLPLVAKAIGNVKNGYLGNSNYHIVESFFSEFGFESAIPSLITTIRNKNRVRNFVTNREFIKTDTECVTEDMGNWKVQVDCNNTYRFSEYRVTYQSLSPVAEGSRNALVSLAPIVNIRHPEITKILSKYERSRKSPHYSTEKENMELVDSKEVGRGYGL